IPPAAGSVTALSTSSTDSGPSLSSASLIALTVQSYPPLPAGVPAWSGGAAAAPGPAHDRRGTNHRDGGAGRGDRRILPGEAASRDGDPASPVLKQDTEGRRVVELRPPARLPQGPAVHHPRINDKVQVGDRRGGNAGPVQPLRGAERQPGVQLDPAQPGKFLNLLLFQPSVAADRELTADHA